MLRGLLACGTTWRIDASITKPTFSGSARAGDAIKRPPEEETVSSEPGDQRALVYILPLVVYLLGTTVAAWSPSDRSGFGPRYPWAYAATVLVTAAVLAVMLRGGKVVVPHPRIGAAVFIGLLGIALWIGLSAWKLEGRLAEHLPAWLRPESRVAYNPFQEFAEPWGQCVFIAIRLVGLAILVPVAEELFWRGFLLRWFISPEWQQVRLGQFSAGSFLAVTLLFTLAHPEWLAAAVYCMLLNGLLYWKKDLWSCIVAHAVSNLVLAIYVVATGNWWLW